MNSILQRYGLPVVVLGCALYLGWPPAKPLDLGDDVIRARAVKWNPADLQFSNADPDVVDPFRQVLVVKEPVQPAAELHELEPTSGPSEQEIRDVVHLTGLAKIGGRTWAIVNGRARLAGDTFRTGDQVVKTCKVVSVHTDHIVVECQQTFAVVRPQVSRGTTTKVSTAPAVVTPVGRDEPALQTNAVASPRTEASPDVAAPPANGAPPTPDAGIPPQASIQNTWNAAIRVATNQL